MGTGKEHKTKSPFQWSRFWGYALIVFGFFGIGDLFTPLRFPVMGIIGGISILAGFVVLIPDKMSFVRKLAERWNKSPKRKELADPLLPVKILKLARARHGILTLSTVAIDLNVPLDEAEAGLDECVRQGVATADYDMAKEIKIYSFKEHLPPEPAGE